VSADSVAQWFETAQGRVLTIGAQGLYFSPEGREVF
jgi:hypothetical protein